jgi:hypothetical protein
MDTELREVLQERADEVRVEPRIPPRVLRRSRRRRVLNAALAGALTVAVTAAAAIGIEAVLPEPRALTPAGSPPADPAERSTEGRADLPAAVEATRDAISEAARARDWDALRDLIPEHGFTFSYGGGRDAIEYWQDLEAEGERPLGILAAVLEMPYAEVEGSFVWPDAFTKEPDELTEEDIETLRPIATEEEIRTWQRLDLYLGWRVGIDRSGTWQFFLAGD